VNGGRFFTEPTDKQLAYIRILQTKLRLTDAMLDLHCRNRFGVPFAACSRERASALIDQLSNWKAVPADLQRAMGQLDLFETGGAS
jgi:hypothetical protein